MNTLETAPNCESDEKLPLRIHRMNVRNQQLFGLSLSLLLVCGTAAPAWGQCDAAREAHVEDFGDDQCGWQVGETAPFAGSADDDSCFVYAPERDVLVDDYCTGRFIVDAINPPEAMEGCFRRRASVRQRERCSDANGSMVSQPGAEPIQFCPDLMPRLDVTDLLSSGQVSVQAQSGLTDVAGDLLQALGQLVVDRVSDAAFAGVRSKLQEWLGCNGTSVFPETCQTISVLTLENLLATPTTLRTAFQADLITLMEGAVESQIPDRLQPTDGSAGWSRILRQLLSAFDVSGLANGNIRISINTVVAALWSELEQTWPDFCAAEPVEQVSALASVGLLRCVVWSQEPGGTGSLPDLGSCPIQFMVSDTASCSSLDCLSEEVRASAWQVAGHLLEATSATDADGVVHWRVRIGHLIEASFDLMCLDDAGAIADCTGDSAGLNPMRRFLLALTQDNLNGAIVAAVQVVQEMANANSDLRRAIEVLSPLLLYAQTYANESLTAEQAQDARLEVLDMVLSQYSNRTMRGGDHIISFGGSLRGTGGVRLGGTSDVDPTRSNTAFYGPVSLGIGFAWDVVASGGGLPGFHLELDLFDLGQYLSFDDELAVQTVDPAAAFAPSLMLALAFFQQTPLMLGVTAGWSPAFEFSDGSNGAFSLGGTVGLYTSFWDLN